MEEANMPIDKKKSAFRSVWDWQPGEEKEDSWWWQVIKESKIPGLKEALKDGIHIALRLFWLCIILGLLAVSIFWIIQSEHKIVTAPVKLSPNNEPLRSGEIPLPAKTFGKRRNLQNEILDDIKRLDDDLYFGDIATIRGLNVSRDALTIFKVVANMLCSPFKALSMWYDSGEHVPREFNEAESVISASGDVIDGPNNEILHHTIAPLIFDQISKCSDNFVMCTLNGRPEKCSSLFVDTMTNLGSSCTFNMMPEELLKRNHSQLLKGWLTPSNISEVDKDAWLNWNSDKTRLASNENVDGFLKTVPAVQNVNGKNGGLSFVLKFDNDEGDTCKQIEEDGYYFAIHSPTEVPDLANHGIFVPVNHIVNVIVQATVIIANEEIRHLSKERRGCIFNDEQSLNVFTKYTQLNCQAECFANHTRNICNCSRLNDPKEPNGRLCTGEDDECLHNATQTFYGGDASTLCPICLPRCTDTIYHMSITTEKYSPAHPPKIVEKNVGINFTTSVVKMYFSEPHVFHLSREFEYTTAEVIGIIGGIVGLTNGISFIEGGRVLAALIVVTIPWHLMDRMFGFIYSYLRRKLFGVDEPPPSLQHGFNRFTHLIFAPSTIQAELGESHQASPALELQQVSNYDSEIGDEIFNGVPNLGEFFARYLRCESQNVEITQLPKWSELVQFIIEWYNEQDDFEGLEAEPISTRVENFQEEESSISNEQGIPITNVVQMQNSDSDDDDENDAVHVFGNIPSSSVSTQNQELEISAVLAQIEVGESGESPSTNGREKKLAKRRWRRGKAFASSTTKVVKYLDEETTPTCGGGGCFRRRLTNTANPIESPVETGVDNAIIATSNNLDAISFGGNNENTRSRLFCNRLCCVNNRNEPDIVLENVVVPTSENDDNDVVREDDVKKRK